MCLQYPLDHASIKSVCKQIAHWLSCLTVHVSQHHLAPPRLSFVEFVPNPIRPLSVLHPARMRNSLNLLNMPHKACCWFPMTPGNLHVINFVFQLDHWTRLHTDM